MPIALFLQSCVVAAASRALLADHNRHLNRAHTHNALYNLHRRSLILAHTTAVAVSSLTTRWSLTSVSIPLSSSSLGRASSGPATSRSGWRRSAITVVAAAPTADSTAAARHVYRTPYLAVSGIGSRISTASFLDRLGETPTFRDMASSGVRRRSSAKKRADGPRLGESESVGIASSSFTSSRPSSISKMDQIESTPERPPSVQLAELMGPPPAPSQTGGTRQSRASTASSTSSSTRLSNPNRLSLTLPLPIALPSPDPTRPTPSSGTSVSHPSNPASGTLTSSNCTYNTSWSTSAGADQSNFIIAIAAQERRVLELREELAHAEAELVGLKNQWTKYEGTKKRGTASASVTRSSGIHSTPSTPRGNGSSALQEDTIAARRSIELDRRRTMLLGQQSTPGSPRRRVLRGGHARTLSLLSPTKTDGTFSVDGDEPMSATLDLERRSTDMGSAYRSAALQKRASWQPRARHTNNNPTVPPSSMGMAAIVEDLKLGFRTLATFVDDIRQVTVGEEPITGHFRRRGDEEWVIGGGLSRSATPSKDNVDQKTMRSSASARPALDKAIEPPRPSTQTPTKASKKNLLDEADAVSDRSSTTAASRKKHFSWAPLEFSNLDDEWAAWDSPLSTKSTRWSESNDTSSDDSSTKNGETDTPLMGKKGANASTLDGLLPQMVNKLSPGNLKRATSDFMGQWEKSLTAPSSPAASSVDDKENLISL